MFVETERKELVHVNLGEVPPDLVIQGGRIVNVHTGEIVDGDVAIKGDRIVATGDIDHLLSGDELTISADGQYVCPGLIEGHLHSYHTYINGTELAKVLLQHGTTAIADGFYGQAIISGVDAVEFLKDEIQDTPLSLIFLAPTIAHYQLTRLGIPRSPNGLTLEDIYDMIEWDDCFGLEEPNYLPITDLEDEYNDAYIELFSDVVDLDKVVTGHAAGANRDQLRAYIAAGASTDHEMSTTEGATVRARNGMYNLMRYGTGLLDLLENAKSVTEDRLQDRQFGFCTDVALPSYLQTRGCIDDNLRTAIDKGVNPIAAVQMATLHTARALRVDQEMGSVSPGKVADIVIVDDLEAFEITTVISDGEIVVDESELVYDFERPEYPGWMKNTIKIGAVDADTFGVNLDSHGIDEGDRTAVRTIKLPEDPLKRNKRKTEPGTAHATRRGDTLDFEAEDVAKVAMLDRLTDSDDVGIGFVEGFGIERGALGISYNAIRENLVVIGTNGEDMAAVANHIKDLQGGVAAASDGEVLADVPMVLFGLQSDQSLDTVVSQMEELHNVVERQLGCDLDEPLFEIEFQLTPSSETPGLRIYEAGYLHQGDVEESEPALFY